MTTAAISSSSWSAFRGFSRLGLFGLTTILLLIPYMLLYPCGARLRRLVSLLWFRACCALTGLNVRVSGEPVTRRPAMIVANHVSYLDIPVLAACIDATFVAKKEVAGWPLFGLLAKLASTVFVDRNPHAVPAQVDAVTAKLGRGEAIMMFPESTSSDGQAVLPFKSALFRVAYPGFGKPQPVIQPVSLVYESTGISRFAWYGDMELFPHLLDMFGRSEVGIVTVRFHEPVHPACFASRKTLAKHCQAVVAAGVRAPAFEAEVEVAEESYGPDRLPEDAVAA